MRFTFSKVVCTLSWMASVVAALATAWWIAIVLDGNYVWATFAFTMMAGSVCVGVLLLAVLPATVLYFRAKQGRDAVSLLLAGCSFVVVLVEAVLLNLVIPMRGE